LFFVPISSIGAIWIIKIEDARLALLPFLAISVIKYILIPLIVSFAAFFLGYGEIEEGLPLKVVIILSAMPVAFTALIPPSIY
jgi:predicted permease